MVSLESKAYRPDDPAPAFAPSLPDRLSGLWDPFLLHLVHLERYHLYSLSGRLGVAARQVCPGVWDGVLYRTRSA
jgi:hypothetical protein